MTGSTPAGPGLGMIWAQAHGGVIGRDGTLPWHLPEDLAHFRQLTEGHTVLMGRSTWQSLPDRSRPLPGRRNLVLSRSPAFAAPGAETFGSLPDALVGCTGPVWVLGGGSVYVQALDLADRIEVTEIDLRVAGDTVAPELDDRWQPTSSDPASGWHTSRTGLRYRFVGYRRAG